MDHEFHCNILKIVCRTTRLSPCGSPVTLTNYVMKKFMIKNWTDRQKSDIDLLKRAEMQGLIVQN